MSQILSKFGIFLFILFIFSTLLQAQPHQFSRKLSPKSVGLKNQKLSHLHFYLHDTLTGPNITAVRVAKATTTDTSRTFFGATIVMDDPLTVGPELTSKTVGRAQGIYAFASLGDIRLIMAFNYVFVEGKYNGSTLSVLGTNAFLSPVREMPIVGGTGVFQFARGYVLAKNYNLNRTSQNAIVEHNVYIQHY